MRTKRAVKTVALMFVLAMGTAIAQKNDDTSTRSVQGIVTDASGGAAPGAVVQLKDTKTLQVRSFIAQQDGSYHFAGLSTNVEYELRADREGATSGTKRLTVFDSRKTADINLKLSK